MLISHKQIFIMFISSRRSLSSVTILCSLSIFLVIIMQESCSIRVFYGYTTECVQLSIVFNCCLLVVYSFLLDNPQQFK